MGFTKIGFDESALDRRERLLEEKRKRDAERRMIISWLNDGKEEHVVYLNYVFPKKLSLEDF